MFRFANVELLYLLILVPVLVIVYLLAVGRRRRLVARFGNPELLRELMPDFSRVSLEEACFSPPMLPMTNNSAGIRIAAAAR